MQAMEAELDITFAYSVAILLILFAEFVCYSVRNHIQMTSINMAFYTSENVSCNSQIRPLSIGNLDTNVGP